MREGATQLRLTRRRRVLPGIDLEEDSRPTPSWPTNWKGRTLPVLHGFPVRFVWPGHQGNDWVKWLVASRSSERGAGRGQQLLPRSPLHLDQHSSNGSAPGLARRQLAPAGTRRRRPY